MTEDEMVDGITHLTDMSLGKTPGDSKGQESMECCSPRGRKKLDVTERLDNSLF